MTHHRVLVTCISRSYPARGYLQHTEPHRNEHLQLVVLADSVICAFKHLVRRHSRHCVVSQEHLCHHHKQRRRYTLARNVRNNYRKVVIIYQEVVVEISADLLCRCHRGENINVLPVGERRHLRRQLTRLQPPCHIKLCGNSLTLSRKLHVLLCVVVDLFSKLCNIFRQQTELVSLLYLAHPRDYLVAVLVVLVLAHNALYPADRLDSPAVEHYLQNDKCKDNSAHADKQRTSQRFVNRNLKILPVECHTHDRAQLALYPYRSVADVVAACLGEVICSLKHVVDRPVFRQILQHNMLRHLKVIVPVPYLI